MKQKLLLLAVLLEVVVVAVGLTDEPLGCAGRILLDGQWKASNSLTGVAINATVPGDLLTDLQTAGILDDLLYDMNYRDPVQTRLFDEGEWVYSTSFMVPTGILFSSYPVPNPLSLYFLVCCAGRFCGQGQRVTSAGRGEDGR